MSAAMATVLEQLFSQTDTGVVVVDGEHRILAWNAGAERLLGWSAAEALGQDVAGLLGPEGSPLRRYVGAALFGDVVQAVPIRLRRNAGGTIDVLLTCRGTNVGRDAGRDARPTALLFLDVAPRHQTISATLAQRTRELQAILGAFPDLFLWTDQEGRVLDGQVGTEVDMVRPLHEFLGRRIVDFVPPEVGTRLQAAVSRALAEHRMVTVEFEQPRGREVRHLEARIVPIGPDRIVAVVRNLSEIRSLQAQVRHSQRLEAVGRFAAGITHDFNNLLTVVGSSIGFLRQELAGDALGAELLDDMAAAADKATMLLRQLLVFGRRDPDNPRTLDLNGLVREDAQLLARLVREDTTIVYELAPEPLWVHADPVRLEQVLFNLCANARDAMPTGGTLTIRTERRGTEPVGGAPMSAPMVALVVADTGIGMDADTLERALDPFFTTKGEQGTGLGLATVHGIARQAGGRVELASTLGEGTVVTVLLPGVAPGSAEVPRAEAAPPAARGSETVLLVEDDEQVRAALARELRHQGYRAMEAGGGEEALRIYLANEHLIRLVVSDVVMVRLGGVELAAELRRWQPHLPIVLISGYERDDTPLPAGVTWLQKPLAAGEFLRVVRATLDAAYPAEGPGASGAGEISP